MSATGELYHHDEHGNLKIEDLERQAALERSGWYVLRIPYRKWLKDPVGQVARVLEALQPVPEEDFDDEDLDDAGGPGRVVTPGAPTRVRQKAHRATREQAAVVEALRSGLRTEEDVLRFARAQLGYKKLGSRIRESLLLGARQLNHAGLLVIEDGEYFLTPDGRSAELRVIAPVVVRRSPARSSRSYPRRRSYGSYRYRRRW